MFVVCEGNYYDGNQGTLWTIENDEPSLYNNSTIGSVRLTMVHSSLIHIISNYRSNLKALCSFPPNGDF